MIFPLFRRSSVPDTISTLYGTIVAQARSPAFYRDYGVPDTVDGRFELLLLHLFLVLRRLDEASVRDKGQQVFDLFCRDMDRNLREMGIGDLKVPNEMRRIGEAYYGRAQAYEMAMRSDDPDALNSAICRNIFATNDTTLPVAARLSTYIREAADHLARQDWAAFDHGEVQFPRPQAG